MWLYGLYPMELYAVIRSSSSVIDAGCCRTVPCAQSVFLQVSGWFVDPGFCSFLIYSTSTDCEPGPWRGRYPPRPGSALFFSLVSGETPLTRQPHHTSSYLGSLGSCATTLPPHVL